MKRLTLFFAACAALLMAVPALAADTVSVDVPKIVHDDLKADPTLNVASFAAVKAVIFGASVNGDTATLTAPPDVAGLLYGRLWIKAGGRVPMVDAQTRADLLEACQQLRDFQVSDGGFHYREPFSATMDGYSLNALGMTPQGFASEFGLTLQKTMKAVNPDQSTYTYAPSSAASRRAIAEFIQSAIAADVVQENPQYPSADPKVTHPSWVQAVWRKALDILPPSK